MNEVALLHLSYPNERAVTLSIAEVTTDRKLQSALGGTGVYNAKIFWRMFLEKVAQGKFCLRFAKGIHLSIQVHVYRLIEELNQLLGVTCFDNVFEWRKNSVLCKGLTSRKTNCQQNPNNR